MSEDTPLDATTEESEPPECVRWTGEDTGVIEIEATRPFIEWLALEADEIVRVSSPQYSCEAGKEVIGEFTAE